MGLDALDLADNKARPQRQNPLLAFHKRGDLVITVRTSTNPEGIERSPSPVKRASSAPMASLPAIPMFSGAAAVRKVPPQQQLMQDEAPPESPASDRTLYDSPDSSPCSTLSRSDGKDGELNNNNNNEATMSSPSPSPPRKPKKTVTFHEEVSRFEYEEPARYSSTDSLEDKDNAARDCTRKVTI